MKGKRYMYANYRSSPPYGTGQGSNVLVHVKWKWKRAPIELVEDPKFVPLNADDPVFGPPALFLMGFDSAETSKMRKFLKELDDMEDADGLNASFENYTFIHYFGNQNY
ncbi:hypothetical protein M5K25_016354 [Dendrobium thyrsiflorum]|uniref:Uncharacterized protein n=1 Tax=Dendrobium thyrsiflorum TaxID=117978 RepID=A0ABD0UJD1_DENTH